MRFIDAGPYLARRFSTLAAPITSPISDQFTAMRLGYRPCDCRHASALLMMKSLAFDPAAADGSGGNCSTQ